MEFKDDENRTFENIIKNLRSPQLQQALILRNYTLSWHLTLAYQYKEIESDEIRIKLDQLIGNLCQSVAVPFDIPLDHIRICHYNDMTKFTPI